MLKIYEMLFDSMMAWYQQWYRGQLHQRIATTLALSVLLQLNVLSAAAILEALAAPPVFYSFTESRVVDVGIFVAFVLVNLHLSKRLFGEGTSTSISKTQPASKNYALIYICTSVVVFVASLAMLWFRIH